jgi:hypothetical protein
MNWAILTRMNLLRSRSGKFLIVFSICILPAAGIIWACADNDPDDNSEYSAFAPEYFVQEKYSPFFYTPMQAYYDLDHGPNANERFNDIVVDEWYKYFNKQFARKSLKYLLIDASGKGVDSVSNAISGGKKLPPAFPDSNRAKLNPKQLTGFFNYLKLAKTCENFSVYKGETDFDSIKRQHSPVNLEPKLLTAFQKENNPFIKERLWFQTVRYYYFSDDDTANFKTVKFFDRYKDRFPKNLTYYRALGYVAGYYYSRKNYALANYLYSRCYDFSYDLEIPSYWSFHPQNESDWNATLALAKSKEEKITLWLLLGTTFDINRSIRAIAAIDPKSDKLNLLLSYMINSEEYNSSDYNYDAPDSVKHRPNIGRIITDSIARLNNTEKPYFWDLAAGYLNYRDSNYTESAKFYAAAKKQLPANNNELLAQSKLLDILLYIKRLKKISDKNEQQLIEPLNWLADIKENKVKVNNLRFTMAVSNCMTELAHLYHNQHQYIKTLCFDDKNFTWDDVNNLYSDSLKVANFITLINKPRKTLFEATMLRYYSYDINALYYRQAMLLAYKDRTKEAMAFLKKRTAKDDNLYGNPFNSRVVDCHDCDHAAPQKQKFTPLSFLATLQTMKDEIKAGRNVYRNAFLIANAYYNITYYGNARIFYETDSFAAPFYNVENDTLSNGLLSMVLAEKYYKLARANAATDNQRATVTFMLSKCALNDIYNDSDKKSYDDDTAKAPNPNDELSKSYYSYFDELKTKYSKTAYYRDALKECGYFKGYINGK